LSRDERTLSNMAPLLMVTCNLTCRK